MTEFDLAPLRLLVFIAVFGLCLICETLWPRRHLIIARAVRWRVNFGLGLINMLLLRLIAPMGLMGIAAYADTGFLRAAPLSDFQKILISLILFDVAIYCQHRLFHLIPFFWLFHRVHHTDRDLDTSSALRFHLGEYGASFAYKAVLIWLLAPPVEAIILFEIILSSCAIFNHSNWSLGRWDAYLRLLIVTPDMHRRHHSIAPHEANHNFGFCLSIWDRLFASYCDNGRSSPSDSLQSDLDQSGLILGVADDAHRETLAARFFAPLSREK